MLMLDTLGAVSSTGQAHRNEHAAGRGLSAVSSTGLAHRNEHASGRGLSAVSSTGQSHRSSHASGRGMGDLLSDAECAVVQVEERLKGIVIGGLLGLALGMYFGGGRR